MKPQEIWKQTVTGGNEQPTYQDAIKQLFITGAAIFNE